MGYYSYKQHGLVKNGCNQMYSVVCEKSHQVVTDATQAQTIPIATTVGDLPEFVVHTYVQW